MAMNTVSQIEMVPAQIIAAPESVAAGCDAAGAVKPNAWACPVPLPKKEAVLPGSELEVVLKPKGRGEPGPRNGGGPNAH